MISAETMAYLEEEKIPYILGARLRRNKEVKEEVLSRAGRYREVHPEGSSAKDPSPEDRGKSLVIRSECLGTCGKIFQAVGVAIPSTIREVA
jgi:hypothetical protein